eukprot:gb/GECG01010040.1/.p1 GENE.gb/GECG01010040.1/~~gb/GECG01010040.1/.p1  ORF type:complete len:1693 (+),score=310.03 gb/GECG01010040.1/:1-5079(+)
MGCSPSKDGGHKKPGESVSPESSMSKQQTNGVDSPTDEDNGDTTARTTGNESGSISAFSLDLKEQTPRQQGASDSPDLTAAPPPGAAPNLGRRKDPNALVLNQPQHSKSTSSDSDLEDEVEHEVAVSQQQPKEEEGHRLTAKVSSGSSIGTDAEETENVTNEDHTKETKKNTHMKGGTSSSDSDTDELEQGEEAEGLEDFLDQSDDGEDDEEVIEEGNTPRFDDSLDDGFTRGREWMSVIKHVFDEAQLSEAQQSQFVDSLEIQNYTEGEYIVKQGEIGQSFFIIESGEVTVEEDRKKDGSKRNVLSRLYPGHHFGEFSLIDEQPRVASVIARSDDVKCRYITKEKFVQLLEQDRRFQDVIFKLRDETEKTRRKRAQMMNRGSENTRQVWFVNAQKTTTTITSNLQKDKDSEGRTRINNYTVLKKIGTGAYGEVSLVRNEDNGENFAMKVVDKAKLRKKRIGLTEDQLLQEVEVMKRLRHPNVVAMLEVINDQSGNKLYMIQELVDGGPIMDEESTSSLPEEEARKYFRQILRGLEYMHFQRVVHRDIKPENILVSKDDTAKLADFGVSTVIPFTEDELNGIQMGEWEDYDDTLTEVQGTPAFMAPELFAEVPRYGGRAADIWSLGASLYLMVVGRPPFNASNQILLAEKLLSDESPTFPNGMSPHLRNLLQQMLSKNASQRISLPNIMKHEWTTHEGTEPLPQTNYIRIGMAPLPKKSRSNEDDGNGTNDNDNAGTQDPSLRRRGRRRRASIVKLPHQMSDEAEPYPPQSGRRRNSHITPRKEEDGTSGMIQRNSSRALKRGDSGSRSPKTLARGESRRGSNTDLVQKDSKRDLHRDSKRDLRRRQMELVQGHEGLSERDKDMLLEQQRVPLHNSRADVTVEEMEMYDGSYFASSEKRDNTAGENDQSASSSSVSGSRSSDHVGSNTGLDYSSQGRSSQEYGNGQDAPKNSSSSSRNKAESELSRTSSAVSYASLGDGASHNASSTDLGRALYGSYSPANLSQKRSNRSMASYISSNNSDLLDRHRSSSAMSWDPQGRRNTGDEHHIRTFDTVRESSSPTAHRKLSAASRNNDLQRSYSDLHLRSFIDGRSPKNEDYATPNSDDKAGSLKSVTSVVSVTTPVDDTPERPSVSVASPRQPSGTSPPSVNFGGPRRRSLGMVPLSFCEDQPPQNEEDDTSSESRKGLSTGAKSMHNLALGPKSAGVQSKSLQRHKDFVMLTENVGTSEKGSLKKKTVIFRARGSGSLSIATPQWGSEKEGFSDYDATDVPQDSEEGKGITRQESSGKACLGVPRVGEAIEEDSDSAEISSLEDEGGFEDVTDKLDEVLNEEHDQNVEDEQLEPLSDVDIEGDDEEEYVDSSEEEEEDVAHGKASDALPLRGITNLRAAQDARNSFLNVVFGVAEDQGKRSTMEDRVMALVEFNEALNLGPDAPHEAFFGVYDGHNGSHCAQYLAERLHANYASYATGGEDPAEALISAFCDTDDHYCLQQQELANSAGQDFQFSGATGCTVVVRKGGKISQEATGNEGDQEAMLVYVANAGDCRAVLSYRGIAYDLSEDHKASREDEQERITTAGGYVHNGRLMGILAVSRAFGDIEYKQLKEKAWETEFEDDPLTAEPDVRAEVVSAGSEFIILACDGVWDVLSSQQAVNFVRRKLVEQQDIQKAAEELVQKAISLNSADNVSAIVIGFVSE